jgi:hypothetical protein
MKNKEILEAARLTPVEIVEVNRFIEDGDESFEFISTVVFEKLFEYFTTDTFEMPYGVAKARTGEPDAWILDRLSQNMQTL